MYESFYGLTGKPFQLNPDPSFYYGSRGHKRAFAYLEYGVYQGEGFIVITGEIGAGKTTIVRSLLEKLDPAKVVAVQLVSTQLDADDLLRAVGAAFGFRSGRWTRRFCWRRWKRSCASSPWTRSAHCSSSTKPRTCRSGQWKNCECSQIFSWATRRYLQSFLVGQPELRRTMQRPQMQQLRQRVIASYHLGPLDKSETQAYIEHRLKHVGWKEDPRFEPACFALIHELTGGIPRRINTICNRLLLAAYLAERHEVTTDDARAIAQEVLEEMGPESGISPAAVVGGAAGTAAEAHPLERIDVPAWHRHFSQMEERIDRLEQTVGGAIDLLHRLLHPEKATKLSRGRDRGRGSPASAPESREQSRTTRVRSMNPRDDGGSSTRSRSTSKITFRCPRLPSTFPGRRGTACPVASKRTSTGSWPCSPTATCALHFSRSDGSRNATRVLSDASSMAATSSQVMATSTSVQRIRAMANSWPTSVWRRPCWKTFPGAMCKDIAHPASRSGRRITGHSNALPTRDTATVPVSIQSATITMARQIRRGSRMKSGQACLNSRLPLFECCARTGRPAAADISDFFPIRYRAGPSDGSTLSTGGPRCSISTLGKSIPINPA